MSGYFDFHKKTVRKYCVVFLKLKLEGLIVDCFDLFNNCRDRP